MVELVRALKVRDIVLFNIVAIVGPRWISLAAATGPSSVSLWLLALILFFIPQGLAVVHLTRKYPLEGGIYEWAKAEFGNFHGFVAGWCYWANNLVYYPSLLISVAAMAAFILPGTSYLSTDKTFIAIVCLLILWIAIGFNVVGVRIGKWVQNAGAIGTFGPIIIIAALAGVLLYYGKSQTSFSFTNMLPSKIDFGTISFWSSMCFGLAGLELASVMSGEIVEAEKTIPRATYLSGIGIVCIYLVGTVALLIGLSSKDVNIVTGLVQSIQQLETKIGIRGLTNISAFLVTLAGIGGAGAWLAGSARILFVTGIDNYLPARFGEIHPVWKTPHVAIIFQGVIATLFLFMSFIGSGTEQAYLVLVDATIVVYFIPYIYIFLAAARSFWKASSHGSRATNFVKSFTSIIGGLTTLVAIVLAMIPPAAGGDAIQFFLKTLGGSLAFVVAGVLIYWNTERKRAARA